MLPEMDTQATVKEIWILEQAARTLLTKGIKITMTTALGDAKDLIESYYTIPTRGKIYTLFRFRLIIQPEIDISKRLSWIGIWAKSSKSLLSSRPIAFTSSSLRAYDSLSPRVKNSAKVTPRAAVHFSSVGIDGTPCPFSTRET